VVEGISTAFRTCFSCTPATTGAILSRAVALHVSLGEQAKKPGFSISSQFAMLRAKLTSATTNPQLGDPFVAAIKNNTIVVATADQADVIAAAIRLKQDFNFPMVISGGAEAHIVAAQLAANQIPVIWRARTPPSTFNTKRSQDNAYSLLKAAGVQTALFIEDDDNPRNLRWEAGLLMESANVHFPDALQAITSNVAAILNLGPTVGQLSVGATADLVAFDDNPLTLQSRVQLTALGTSISCQPEQR